MIRGLGLCPPFKQGQHDFLVGGINSGNTAVGIFRGSPMLGDDDFRTGLDHHIRGNEQLHGLAHGSHRITRA